MNDMTETGTALMARCPDCGRRVADFFDHVDVDCLSAPYASGVDDREANRGLFAGMRRYKGDDQTRYIQGWHNADSQGASNAKV